MFDKKFQREALKYHEKLENEILNGERKSCYAALGKLGDGPGQDNTSVFSLPSHIEKRYTAAQSAEVIADNFASISQCYAPINISNFPPKMREDLGNPNMEAVPKLEDYDVYRKIRKSRKPNSSVPGDLPKKVILEFSCELATPMTVIFNSILKTLKYPKQWIVEYQIPNTHSKIKPPLF